MNGRAYTVNNIGITGWYRKICFKMDLKVDNKKQCFNNNTVIRQPVVNKF